MKNKLKGILLGEISITSDTQMMAQNWRRTKEPALMSHTSKMMPKILQTRLQQYMNHEFMNQMFKLVLEKAEEPETKLPTSAGSSKKQESSRKSSISALLTMPKPLTVWITTNCGKFLKIWEYQTTCPASWKICMEVKKQMLELDMEEKTGSQLEGNGKALQHSCFENPIMQISSWKSIF